MRWGYRIEQFALRIRSGFKPALVDLETARNMLPEAAYALFAAMPRGDQAHALAVLRALRREGCAPPEVEQAALLHDVGKSRRGLTLIHRILIVLLEEVAKESLNRLAASDPSSWRYPFHAHLHHGEMGAQQCETVGCSPLTVALVRYHDSGPDACGDPILERHLLALQRADDAC